MQTITLEEAKENYPNMITVLQVVKPVLKDNFTRVIAQKDVADIFNVYVDTSLSEDDLFAYYHKVPEEISQAEIGAAMLCHISQLGDRPKDTRLLDVTDAVKELYNAN